MEIIDYSYGSFEIVYRDGSDLWYLAIHPEMYPARQGGIKPSDNYFIYCIHPSRGSCAFIVKQDKNYNWVCEKRPRCISTEFVHWLGKQIELNNLDF